MKANYKWVLIKRATMATQTDGGIYLPGSHNKPVCYGVVVGVGPEVPDHIEPGQIAWFDAQWQEQFAVDQHGKDNYAALPHQAIYCTATMSEAEEMGAKLTDEIRETIAGINGVAVS